MYRLGVGVLLFCGDKFREHGFCKSLPVGRFPAIKVRECTRDRERREERGERQRGERDRETERGERHRERERERDRINSIGSTPRNRDKPRLFLSVHWHVKMRS